MKANQKPNPKLFLVAVLLIFSQAVQAGTVANIFSSTKAETNATDKVEEFRWKEINYIVRSSNPTTGKLCEFSRLNWSIGYELSGLLRHYFVTKNPESLAIFSRVAAKLIKQRNAFADKVPYGWREPHSNYEWHAYSAHLYLPMLEFVNHIQARGDLREIRILESDHTYFSLGKEILSGYRKLDQVHSSNLRVSSRAEYFFSNMNFSGPAECDKLGDKSSLTNTSYPVNMNSIVFTAKIVYARYLQQLGPSAASKMASERGLVAKYIRHLGQKVFKVGVDDGYRFLYWLYNDRFKKDWEDLPHANATVNFVFEAKRAALLSLANENSEHWPLWLGNTLARLIPEPAEGDDLFSNKVYGPSEGSDGKTIFYLAMTTATNSRARHLYFDWVERNGVLNTRWYERVSVAFAHLTSK